MTTICDDMGNEKRDRQPNKNSRADISARTVLDLSSSSWPGTFSLRMNRIMNLPFFKFYVQDWAAGEVQCCSLETQAIYINLLCRLWKNRGQLVADKAVLARWCRADESKVEAALEELLKHDIISISKKGEITVKFIEEQLEDLTQAHINHKVAGHLGGLSRANAKGKQSLSKSEVRSQKSDSESDTDKNKTTWMTPYFDVWKAKYGGDMPCDKVAIEFRRLEKTYKPDEICRGLKAYFDATEVKYVSIPAFAQKAGYWIGKTQPRIEPPTPPPSPYSNVEETVRDLVALRLKSVKEFRAKVEIIREQAKPEIMYEIDRQFETAWNNR